MERIMVFMMLTIVGGMFLGMTSNVNAADEKQWENSPIGTDDFFPICVWAQSPHNAPKYKALGINTYFALFAGPTEDQLAELARHDMYTICALNNVGMKNLDNPIIIGWMHGDEPDNFVKDRATGQWVPKHSSHEIIADFKKMAAKDPSRPIVLNLGQGVANDENKGNWAKEKDYRQFVKGAHVISFDVYPVTNIKKKDGENYLWYQAKGVNRIREWSNDQVIPWHFLECTHISNSSAKATPHQVRAQVWIGIIHGSKGISYFVHQFVEPKSSASLLGDEPMKETIKQTNFQIQRLARVINSPTVDGKVSVKSSNPEVPVASMVKEYGGSLYIFAVTMRNGTTTASFEIEDVEGAKIIEIVDEDRFIQSANGKFSEDFQPWDVRIFKVSM